MKDYTKEELEEAKCNWDVKTAINFCLEQIYKDRKHTVDDKVANVLSYEELIGCLLVAKDFVEMIERDEEREWEENYSDIDLEVLYSDL